MTTQQKSYSKAEAAAHTGMSQQTISRAIKAGKLRAKYSGETPDGLPAGKVVILDAALDAWLDSLADA